MTSNCQSRAELETALTPLVDALRADGYDLVAEPRADRSAHLVVSAGPDACADCLVPPTLFESICADRLSAEFGGRWTVSVDYPTASAAGR